MAITRKEYPGAIRTVDYGKEEYLDGAQMQYSVEKNGSAIAYFSNKNDAALFAMVKAAGLKP